MFVNNICQGSRITEQITKFNSAIPKSDMTYQDPKATGAAHESSLESRYRKLLHAVPDAILEVDQDGRITILNEAAERMFGYTRAEFLGLNVESLVPAAMRSGHAKHRSSYAAHPNTRPMGTGLELQGQRKDGSLFPVEISLSPNWIEGSLHVIASVRDITKRKAIEDRLRSLREQYTAELTLKNEQLEARNREVERANRLKTEFLASMSHELRTPLHTIIGFSELLAEQLEGVLNDKQQRFVGHILQDARHLLELINEVLDISKIESGRLELKRESFDFNACVEEVMAGIRHQAATKNIQLENQNAFHDSLYADRVRMKEILYNLLNNAVKFTPEGGHVWIEAARQGEALHISVCDTGIGIPENEQPSIFEKFYQVGDTTGGVREGTGLGLPITKHLIELHGGAVSVASQPGKGSSFRLVLPLVQERAA